MVKTTAKKTTRKPKKAAGKKTAKKERKPQAKRTVNFSEMKSDSATTQALHANRKWYLVDAKGKPVGRLATLIATLLRGKHRPSFTRHLDSGDFVVVVNAGQAVFTGKKTEQKYYHYHTGFIGGLKSVSAGDLLQTKPGEVIRHAVAGMLPKSALGKNQINKLKVYAGSDHPHAAQRPEQVQLS